ncbi:purine-binding chemotaxis protein [Novipirellula galeiformis]|uniref:Purine-binding chemotaxis protein n=1 Tax=Novipirellula galeiformis TaxID=2528004 RepID=A0A5C6CAV9_9BACT|nr:chemotaxis protein CheW [Novipirellula galeiformis]TWU20526.1 purine-binding chemotaxis protein [Novipirellula galeiformis]
MIAPPNHNPPLFDWADAKQRLEKGRRSLLDAEQLTPEQSQQVLQERARQLACVPAQALDNRQVMEVVRFRLGREEFAIASEYVLELTYLSATTPIPQTPPHFVGVTNLRGEVTAIIDLGKLLKIPPDADHSNASEQPTQVLVLGQERPEFAMVISGMEHLTILRRDELLDPVGVTGSHRDLMLGCTKDGVLVFSGEALLRCDELNVDQSE